MGKASVTPVAVIGMACRLPGGINSPDLFWEALLRGDDLVTEIPADRWDVDYHYDPEPGVPGRSICKWGSFLDGVGDFDPDFFGITEKEATAMDPQHRLLMETAWEAMEHAGLTRRTIAAETGVFVGLNYGDYQFVHIATDAFDGPYGNPGTISCMASGRIAYALGLHGPAVTVDTACSSGLFAIHQACRSLNDGESNLAFAGGVNVMMEPRRSASASAGGMLSGTGHCRAFDVKADGFVSGEGCVVLLLKRLPDARRDGDRILGVIRSTAVNQNGHTISIATPSREAQTAVYRAALATAGVDAGTVGMVEAHGTGTLVGDSIEYASLSEVYGVGSPCILGASKTNFGHTQAAAGALGMMKALLAVRHGIVPKNLHFEALPDEMARIDTELFVPKENTPWPLNDGQPRRAAVSAYGLSGTNVHAIVEEPPKPLSGNGAAIRPARDGLFLFPLTSSSAKGLQETAGRLADWVEARASDLVLPDLAYTLARRRDHRSVRTTMLAGTNAELVAALREVANGDAICQEVVGRDERGPVWVFSGQGSQWAAMGADLLANEPAFAAAIAEIEPLIAAESGFSVTAALTAPEKVTGIDRIQPAIFAMQVALAATMRSYGVQPGAVIGHSMGEAAAAVVAGALSLEDAARIICRRSRLMTKIAGSGAMASVELPAQQVLSELTARGVNDAVVAVVSSPQSTVIGGATGTVRELIAAWEKRDVMAREVAVDVASHSPQVDPILDELYDVLAEIEPLTPKVRYYSATSFDPREEPYCDADYWVDNLRHTVRFSAAVQAALEDGFRVFGELSPHPLLTHAIEQTARSLDMTVAALAAMRKEQRLPHGLRGLLGDFFVTGAAVDFSLLYPGGHLIDAPLPAWTHRSLLLSREGHSSRALRSSVAVHPLMGQHVRLPEQPERHVWQAEIGTATLPWLGDHQVHGTAALAGAAYCEMALTAARTIFGEASGVRDVRFEQMLLLDEQKQISLSATAEVAGTFAFTVETSEDGTRARRASAVLHKVDDEKRPAAEDIDALLASHPKRVQGANLRDAMDLRGIHYGPAFAGLAAARTTEGNDTTVLAEIGLPSVVRIQQSSYGVHPALLDACFQSIAAHPSVASASLGGLLLPLGVRQLRAYGPISTARYCHSRVTAAKSGAVEADLDVLDNHGNVLLTVRGLQMGMGVSASTAQARLMAERLLTVEWQQRDLPEVDTTEAGAWLLVSTSDAADRVAMALTDAMKSREAECTTLSWPRQADHRAMAERLRREIEKADCAGVVVITGPKNGNAGEESAARGGEYVRHVVRIARELTDIEGRSPRLYVITGNAQKVLADDVPNLDQGGLRGLLRVIGAEYPHLHTTHIDVDEHTSADQVARQLLLMAPGEDETAWRNDKWYTARLCPAPLRPDERQTTVAQYERDGMRMHIRTPGDLQTIEFAAFDRIPPGPGQIEVAVTASSINFADVLNAFGLYRSVYRSLDGILPRLGTDFAGVVTAVGSGVTNHKIGDHVGGMSVNGCWATFVTCDARLATKLPEGMTDAEAAAVTTAHATAWYGLNDLARIKPGDKVLIHSGTGGVGQAAIAIARAAGAEVFATAGSEQRRQLLRDMGIAHVYDSRSVEFGDQIRRDTAGYGVDVVLNSVTGAAQLAGLNLLALGGRFIEIGKRDIYEDTKLGLSPFRRNLAFWGVDLGLMSVSHPRQVSEILGTVYRLVADGVLPGPKSTHYPLFDAVTAIRAMSAAEHTGKLVLDIPRVGRGRVVLPPEQVPAFRRDGSYIITGGLGGLGLFLAEKMAAAGAGRIVLNSRSEPTAKALATIERIRSIGADVVVERGDIASLDTAQRLLATATATGVPLRGVLHAAAVVEDATLTNITDELIDRDWAPKVHGAWNLHEATATADLDWFCLFSSAAALLGSPGQGAYAAANSWLDGFAHWRRAQGLPATAIAWGAWQEIGRGAEFAEGSGGAITPDEGAYAFEELLRHDRGYTGYSPLVRTPWITSAAERCKFFEMFKAAGEKRSGPNKLRAELAELPRDEWPARLRRLLSEQIGLSLRRNINPDQPLSEYGLDSLGNLELRIHIEAQTGVRITSADITTVRGLADHLVQKLAPKNENAATHA